MSSTVDVQAGRYLSVAVQSALADWGMFVLLVTFGAEGLTAQAIARLVGGAYSFAANKLWSFQAGGWSTLAPQAWRFLVLYAVSYLLSLGLFQGMTTLAMSPWVAKPLADGGCFVFNFFVMRSWVFVEDTSELVEE